MSDDELSKRFLLAEKIERQNLSKIPEKKIKWRTVYCPKCRKKVEYVPRDNINFTGMVKCLECGRVFTVPSLDGFLE